MSHRRKTVSSLDTPRLMILEIHPVEIFLNLPSRNLDSERNDSVRIREVTRHTAYEICGAHIFGSARGRLPMVSTVRSTLRFCDVDVGIVSALSIERRCRNSVVGREAITAIR